MRAVLSVGARHIGVLLLLLLGPAQAETRLTGYGSFVIGKTLSGDSFLSDYPKTGIYDKDWSSSPDTSIGIQLISTLDDHYDFVVQLNAHGAREYDPEISWAYLNYYINPELSLQIGRKRLPLYYYSDFFDVGYAYYWIRPPADNYTWQISHYNGLSLLYETQFGVVDTAINFYTGREDSRDNDLLSYLGHNEVDETWKNMFGLVAEFNYRWFNFRITTMRSELDRRINGSLLVQNRLQQFGGISINLTPGRFTLLSEFNGYRRDDDNIKIHTRMLSMAYAIGDFKPYVTYSDFEQDLTAAGGDEAHSTRSVGVRWDFDRNLALKIQYDDTRDDGVTSPLLGDSELLAIGIDVVF